MAGQRSKVHIVANGTRHLMHLLAQAGLQMRRRFDRSTRCYLAWIETAA